MLQADLRASHAEAAARHAREQAADLKRNYERLQIAREDVLRSLQHGRPPSAAARDLQPSHVSRYSSPQSPSASMERPRGQTAYAAPVRGRYGTPILLHDFYRGKCA